MKYVLLLLALISAPFASADFSASATIGSDYLFRGVSQNQGPAASGHVGFETESGFHASAWASQVDFDSEAEFEYDLTVGKTFTAGDITLDVSYIDYNYHDEEALDLEEVSVTFGYKAVSLAYFAGLEDATDYMEVGVDLGFAGVSAGTVEDFGWHWQASKTIDVEGVDVTFGYRSFYGDDGVADEKSAVLMLTKSF